MSALTGWPDAMPLAFVFTSNTATIFLGDGRAEVSSPCEQPVDADEVRSQLKRMLASRTFERMARISQILAFLVEQTLAGEQTFTEQEIAVRVFYRPPTFDPRFNSIVRVQARRLRNAVERYYETEGRDDSVRIEFPQRSYAPRFSLRRWAARAA